MKHSWLAIVTTLLVGTACSTRAFGQTVTQAERGPAVARAAAEKSYARIAILRPHDGHRRLRSRIHPTPRVASAGEGHVGVV